MNNLNLRIFTAAVLIPLVLFLIFKMTIVWLFGFFLLLVFLGFYEFFKLTKISTVNQVLIVAFIVLVSIQNFPAPGHHLFPWLGMLLFCIVVLVWWLKNILLVLNYPNKKPSTSPLLIAINGILLFTPLLFIASIGNKNLVLLLFLIVWSADSFAYIFGQAFGQHKLAPNLSSGKTIEGFIGGLLGTISITLIWLYFNDIASEFFFKYLLLSIIVATFSVVGDLYESIYKREANVKDSGILLPGHGGILDRIDGLLAATPVFIIGTLFI